MEPHLQASLNMYLRTISDKECPAEIQSKVTINTINLAKSQGCDEFTEGVAKLVKQYMSQYYVYEDK